MEFINDTEIMIGCELINDTEIMIRWMETLMIGNDTEIMIGWS